MPHSQLPLEKEYFLNKSLSSLYLLKTLLSASLSCLKKLKVTYFYSNLSSQSYDFGIYNYNASVVMGQSFFNLEKNILVFKMH
jgi:hypothetical protein